MAGSKGFPKWILGRNKERGRDGSKERERERDIQTSDRKDKNISFPTSADFSFS